MAIGTRRPRIKKSNDQLIKEGIPEINYVYSLELAVRLSANSLARTIDTEST